MVFLPAKRSWSIVAAIALSFAFTRGTGGGDRGSISDRERLSGNINVDGSVTFLPISEAMAEEFMHKNLEVRVPVGVSGSGGGFKKFCGWGDIDIINSSRPIRASEIELCKAQEIEFVEIPIAFEALAVVVNKDKESVENKPAVKAFVEYQISATNAQFIREVGTFLCRQNYFLKSKIASIAE